MLKVLNANGYIGFLIVFVLLVALLLLMVAGILYHQDEPSRGTQDKVPPSPVLNFLSLDGYSPHGAKESLDYRIYSNTLKEMIAGSAH